MGSPAITFSRLPTVSMSKTTIGMRFSLHRAVAVRSITLSPRLYTSSYVISLNFVAVGSFFGVGCVYAVDSCAFEHHLCLDLYRAQGRACVGSEERVACASGDYCHFAVIEGLDSFPFAVALRRWGTC